MIVPRLIGLAALVAIATATPVRAQSGPDIPFAADQDTALKDPDNPEKKFRIDFARVEAEAPLTRQQLMSITPEYVKTLSQERVDQIYGRITAGPIPDGKYFGDLFFALGDSITPKMDFAPRIQEIFGGLEGRLAGLAADRLEKLGREMWKGKVFSRNERVLRNMIEDKPIIRLITDNRLSIKKETVPRDWLLSGSYRQNTVWLLFPAKLYCGQSLLDGRRESVIVDYNYSDDGTVTGYRKSPDSLAGRGGLRIRDEIRMVRPGFYLGRAYTNRMFLLNFTLFNAEVANRDGPAFAAGGPVAEDCWPGEQARKTVAR